MSTISSNSQTNPFQLPENLDQSWLIPYAATAHPAVAVNVGDLMYDAGAAGVAGGKGVAYPAGQQASQSSEAADQKLFARYFIGCATDGCLSTETNATRRINVQTRGTKWFTCPSQTFAIGDPVGIYSDGTNPPDPTQVDAALAPHATIGVVVPVPGDPTYYASAVTRVLVYFSARESGEDIALQQSRTPFAQYVSISAGNGTLAAGNMEGALDCTLATSGATAMTTRTAAQIFANIPGAQVGMTYLLRVYNTNAGTLTLTGGTGVTITGTATIAANVWRDYLVTINTTTTITLQNLGSGTAN